MPPPIVPAPTTAARLMSLRRRVLRDVGHLRRLALGEEQVAQRLRLGRDDAFGEQLALAERAGVEAQLVRPASMASTAANGARTPFARLRKRRAHRLRRPSSPASRRLGVDRDLARLADLARRAPSLSRTRSRRAADRRRRSRRRCRPRAPSAPATGLPSVHISSASSAPHRRGSRCVPPAPGMMPSSTSGWPTFASLRRDAVVAGHARPRGRRRARCRESRRRAAWARPRARLSSACVPADRASDSLARLQRRRTP